MKPMPSVARHDTVLPGEILLVSGEPCVFTGFFESKSATGTNKIIAQVVKPNGEIAEHPIYIIGACRGDN